MRLRHANLVVVGCRRVAQLMRDAGSHGRIRRRFRVTTNSAQRGQVKPYNLDLRSTLESTGRIWAVDIRSPARQRVRDCNCYRDLHSRPVIGWSTATQMMTELLSAASCRMVGLILSGDGCDDAAVESRFGTQKREIEDRRPRESNGRRTRAGADSRLHRSPEASATAT